MVDKNAPLISVIVPVYNVEKYLDRCLITIINQTYTNLEIILVDDGSPDNSPQMCDEYALKDKRIKVIHKENGGLSDARNVGLENITGDYVSFVDSDDWITLDAIEYLYHILLKYDADFSMGQNVRCVAKQDVLNEAEDTLLSQYEFLKKFFKYGTQENVQYACAKLYRKEIFENIRYPKGLTSEDVAAMFEIAINSKRIAYTDKIVYFYYINEASITEMKFTSKRFDLLEVWKLVVKKSIEYDCNDWIKHQAKINYYRAYFGVLSNLAMADLSKKERKEYKNRQKELIKVLKKHRRILVNSRIPVSRKILINMYCLSYSLTSFGIRTILRLKKMKG